MFHKVPNELRKSEMIGYKSGESRKTRISQKTVVSWKLTMTLAAVPPLATGG